MERIILACGGDKKIVQAYTRRSLPRFNPLPPLPFWLDLLSPSEPVARRISASFGFHPRTLQACLAHYRIPGCEDLGNHLFVKALLLEPSKKNLFVQTGMTAFLNRQYLITVHKRTKPLHRLLPGCRASAFTQTGKLFLSLLDRCAGLLIESFACENNRDIAPGGRDAGPVTDPLWWRLRNFRAALLKHARLLNELAFVGAKYFDAEELTILASIRAKIHFVLDMVTGSLYQMNAVERRMLNGIKKERP
ncbi:MAG: hypothetical protein HY695_28890 [Deltaproteobacteria bacterium]|nr:hypothetical protein [Deltaproteobacteria bacterium]